MFDIQVNGWSYILISSYLFCINILWAFVACPSQILTNECPWLISVFLLLLQAIDHIINSAAKSNYMSAGQINVPIVFRGPNGAAAGVGAQHSQVRFSHVPFGPNIFLEPVSVSFKIVPFGIRDLLKSYSWSFLKNHFF